MRGTKQRPRPVETARGGAEASAHRADEASAQAGAVWPAPLSRPFRIIAFDWDGTAVESRRSDAGPVRERIERLLKLGVFVVVITGTNFQNVDRQLSAGIVGPHKSRLYICTNRGSEVYGFDARSEPVLLSRRVATPDEERLLTQIADEVAGTIKAQTGLDIEVIYDRLNRRKIDLIPVSEWRDPPKSAIGELLAAVQERLARAGYAGGLRAAMEVTRRVARERGVPQARITSDVKHLEVGLTDKADSVRWLMTELAPSVAARPEDVLIGGDEFGPVGGFEGSDYRMLVPAAAGAVFVSVGPEPSGVPPGVIHLGGGPPRFWSLLDEQIELHERDAASPAGGGQPAPDRPESRVGGAAPSPEPGWSLVEEGFEPAREHEIESLFTVANGYVGTRGSLQEGSALSLPQTFVAGVYNRPESTISQLVVAPDWARLTVSVDGEELRLDEGRILEHRRWLDIRRGVLVREWRQEDDAGRITRLRFLRFASLDDRHALVETVTLVPENYGGTVSVESIVDGRVISPTGVSHLQPLTLEPTPPKVQQEAVPAGEPLPVLAVRPLESGPILAFAVAGAFSASYDVDVERTLLGEPGWVGERWTWEAEIGQAYRIDKLVAAYTSRDSPAPAAAAIAHAAELRALGADFLLERHAQAWARRWAEADVRVECDERAQTAIRLAIYHLIATVNPEDPRVSIGARALTGEAYKGHVFWDTEIYLLPFYDHTHPAAARTLLLYRYHGLPAALAKARSLGYRGALYPWESTDTGEEASPTHALGPEGEVVRVLTGALEHHISADVAYAVWQYWRATGDDGFFLEAGAEIVLETARFWASRVSLGEDGRYHILNVIGPDEYHEGVDDDAYTNGMARWNLERGAETVTLLASRWPARWEELRERLGVTADEPEEWQRIARAMYIGFDPATGIIEQFRGYFDLDYVDLAAYEPRTVPMDVLLGPERTAQTQIIKQPDVILLIYLLWDQFSPEVRAANFRYYEPRCGHGSSLSPSIHALVAARLGDVALAQRFFDQSVDIDLANNMGNAAGGVHIAALGGLWQSVVFGCAGMQVFDAELAFDPHLLPRWRGLRAHVQFRGRRLEVGVEADPRSLEVRLASGKPLAIAVGGAAGATLRVEGGRSYRVDLSSGKAQPQREVA